MNRLLFAVLIATTATPASSGELLSGTHPYRPDYEMWTPVPATTWVTVTMVGEYEPMSGSIPKGRVECRGANFRNKSNREAGGVCVFGEAPDVWMLRYRQINTNRASRSNEGYKPIGEWTVVGGTGRYSGMTGSGTYLAEGIVTEDQKQRTRWEGEITIPK